MSTADIFWLSVAILLAFAAAAAWHLGYEWLVIGGLTLWIVLMGVGLGHHRQHSEPQRPQEKA